MKVENFRLKIKSLTFQSKNKENHKNRVLRGCLGKLGVVAIFFYGEGTKPKSTCQRMKRQVSGSIAFLLLPFPGICIRQGDNTGAK